MKMAKSAVCRLAADAQVAPRNLAEYLVVTPEPARAALLRLRATILSLLPPEATDTISYRMPASKHNGVLVW
jgi:uncharacterized protein YdhG (YjbR/CyaY superfamily)